MHRRFPYFNSCFSSLAVACIDLITFNLITFDLIALRDRAVASCLATNVYCGRRPRGLCLLLSTLLLNERLHRHSVAAVTNNHLITPLSFVACSPGRTTTGSSRSKQCRRLR